MQKILFIPSSWNSICGETCIKYKAENVTKLFSTCLKGPIKAAVGNKITPNHVKTTYRSIPMFEEKKRSITHLFKTFSVLQLGCNAFILAKRLENMVK